MFAKVSLLCPAMFLACLGTRAIGGEIRQYQVTFVSEWHFTTHPGAFPGGAHFTTLIGGTHNANVRFWQPGGVATAGLEAMAERGQITPLDLEVKAAIDSGTAWSIVQAPGTLVTPATTVSTFDVDSDYPLITLTSMVAPSPDWFVGVDSLLLFENGKWRPLVSVDLFPYDAGTDSGVIFDSANADTQPRAPISQLSGYPFTNLPRLGTMTFALVPEPSSAGLLALGFAALAARLGLDRGQETKRRYRTLAHTVLGSSPRVGHIDVTSTDLTCSQSVGPARK